MDDKKKRAMIINGLRQASYRYPVRAEARKAAKVAYGQYKCAVCKCIDGPKSFEVDHIEPVVPITGFDDWQGYVTRMFCTVEELQLLCKPCHKAKTKEENAQRRAYKKNDTAKEEDLE